MINSPLPCQTPQHHVVSSPDGNERNGAAGLGNTLKSVALAVSGVFATIILMADHGIHDGVDGIPYPTAATPMLMIKDPHASHDSIVLNLGG